MGNVAGWLTGCLFPEEQAPWHAANAGDFRGLRDAIARLTPETRRYLEWQDSCSGRTPLAQAAAKGRLQCVIELVQAGVNVNAKDYKGNTPLHLAARHGHADVVRFLVNNVQVVPFEVNIQLQTPLDVARERLRRRGCDDSSRHAHAKGYEASIEELEKKFYLYSGWVYEKTDNLISAVSGISNLSSWKHRFCIVLQRGLPDILELALFSARKGDLRPTLPSSVILYHVQSGFHEIMDAKWFNRKEYAFTISGSVLQRDGQWEERRRAAPTQAIELAAIDAEGFQMWKSFFHHHEEMLAASRLTGSASYYASPPPPAAPLLHPPHPPPPAPPMPFMGDYKSYPADYVVVPRQQSGESSRSSITTMSTLRDEDQEEEDLRRAIELSLRESTVMGTQPPQPIESSAPAWTDEETAGLSGSYTGQSDPVSMTLNGDNGQEEKAPALPATSESSRRLPSYSSIGECVVCFDGPQAAVCVPCGHNAVCMTCAEEILETTCECPVCRHPIREVIKLYRV